MCLWTRSYIVLFQLFALLEKLFCVCFLSASGQVFFYSFYQKKEQTALLPVRLEHMR